MKAPRGLFPPALAVALLGAGGLFFRLQQPYGSFQDEVFVEIPKGTGTRAIAEVLAKAGVIRGTREFLLVRAFQPRAVLQAGEYRFTNPASPWDVFKRIAHGEVFYQEVTVPEGSNVFDIAVLLEEGQVAPAAKILEAARDPSLVRDLDPRAPSLEGYLFPATYRFTRRTGPKQVLKDMTARFRKAWGELKAPAGTDPHRVVTMASLVEKETGKAGERALVASVFENRLRAGMTLDCDPTTIYAALLGERYRGKIHRSDLDSEHPYNTYRHQGLPPGPIANPGMASLEAALHPAETDYLYFVAKPNGVGSHNFSASLRDHRKAVSEYRRGR